MRETATRPTTIYPEIEPFVAQLCSELAKNLTSNAPEDAFVAERVHKQRQRLIVAECWYIPQVK